MTKQRIFYIQLALEASIPLMGYFLWDWSLYFILLFYLLDIVASELIIHFKAKRIYQYQNSRAVLNSWVSHGLISLVVFSVVLIMIHIAMMGFQPGIDFYKEAVAFWNYKDLGIKQGYLFVPLVLLMNWQQFKIDFVYTARHRTTEMKILWKQHLIGNVIIVAAALVSWVIIQFVALNELVFIISILTGILIYKLIINRH